MRTFFNVVDKSKIVTIHSGCDGRCPACGGPCIGAPKRYRRMHTCLDLHQWVTPISA